MGKILEFYNNLPLKTKILILIIFCIILGVTTSFLSNSSKEITYASTLNYKELNIDNLKENYYEGFDDRDAYIILKNICDKILLKENTGIEVYEEYYSVLDSNYSKHISKGKFSEKLSAIANKIKENDSIINFNMYTENSNNNVYILEFMNNNQEVLGYIGFILDYTRYKYSIFYLE